MQTPGTGLIDRLWLWVYNIGQRTARSDLIWPDPINVLNHSLIRIRLIFSPKDLIVILLIFLQSHNLDQIALFKMQPWIFKTFLKLHQYFEVCNIYWLLFFNSFQGIMCPWLLQILVHNVFFVISSRSLICHLAHFCDIWSDRNLAFFS